MNDLVSKKVMCWTNRLKKCMNEGRYTQTSFVEALNNKYGTRYGQKDVSRWMNAGTKNKNGEVGFPKYETMIRIADFFNVDVCYLTGETDEDSFLLEEACSYMGLSGEAIKAIIEITQPENEASYMIKDMRESFNMFLSAKRFPDFFYNLYYLYNTSISPQKIEEHVFENIDIAIDNQRESEFAWKIQRYELNEALIMLINEIYPNPSLLVLTNKK